MTNSSPSAAQRVALGHRRFTRHRRSDRPGAGPRLRRRAFTYAASADKANEVVREVQRRGGKALAMRRQCGGRSCQPRSRRPSGHRRLDILINNAGIMVLATAISSRSTFRSDAGGERPGALLRYQAAARHMGPGGRAITIGSIVADRSAFPGSSVIP